MGYNFIFNGIGTAVGYQKLGTIIIDHTKVGGSNHTNYRCEISISSANLKTVANGGFVQNTTTVGGYTVPADLVFSSDSAGSSLYNFEIESYDPVNGVLVAWVLVPSVSHTVDTTFYMPYDNTAITTFQGGLSSGVWSSPYVLSMHFKDGTTLSMLDSTLINTVTNSGLAAIAGKIDGAAVNPFPDTNQAYTPYSSSFDLSTGDYTMGYWIKFDSLEDAGAGNVIPFSKGFYGASFDWGMFWNTGGFSYDTQGTGTSVDYSTTISDNVWYRSIVTSVSGIVTLYLNGVSVASGSLTTGNADTSHNIGIFAYSAGYVVPLQFNFTGSMDELFLINGTGWTADDVTADYNNGNNPGILGRQDFIQLHNMETHTPIEWAAQSGDTIPDNILNCKEFVGTYLIPTILNYPITQVEYEKFMLNLKLK